MIALLRLSGCCRSRVPADSRPHPQRLLQQQEGTLTALLFESPGWLHICGIFSASHFLSPYPGDLPPTRTSLPVWQQCSRNSNRRLICQDNRTTGAGIRFRGLCFDAEDAVVMYSYGNRGRVAFAVGVYFVVPILTILAAPLRSAAQAD